MPISGKPEIGWPPPPKRGTAASARARRFAWRVEFTAKRAVRKVRPARCARLAFPGRCARMHDVLEAVEGFPGRLRRLAFRLRGIDRRPGHLTVRDLARVIMENGKLYIHNIQ